ncbi:MAG: hypothetical protein F4181_15520 [Proteobacteria bacterium]|nr:hypothetical protein [Pseudomonadota bacterium]
MNTVRIAGFTVAASLSALGAAQTDSELTCDCMPVTGQPAADVLASEDLWGNPTFIGGITNKGPDSGSVW